MPPTAYTTDNPDAVTAYMTARDAETAFARSVIGAAAKLGKNKGVLRTSSVFGHYITVGLAADDPDDPPAGWVYSTTKEYLVPARGRAGQTAREWLAEHQPPKEASVREVLAEHGLPLNDMEGSDGRGAERFGLPALAHHNGRLFALYQGTPGLWCAGDRPQPITWEPCNLSEYYAAQEAAQAADAAAKNEPTTEQGGTRG